MKTHEAEKTIIVVGCGCSASLVLPYRKKVTTIGVNDIDALFAPDYLVVVDPPLAFSDERRKTVENSKSKILFTPRPLWSHERQVIFNVGGTGTDLLQYKGGNSFVNHSITSPYIAVIIAFYLGATNIGLLGVDFTDNHFNNKDGKHNLYNRLHVIDNDFGHLRERLADFGCELVNLSPESLLKSLPKVDIKEWTAKHKTRK